MFSVKEDTHDCPLEFVLRLSLSPALPWERENGQEPVEEPGHDNEERMIHPLLLSIFANGVYA
jgi:hypothetical protein